MQLVPETLREQENRYENTEVIKGKESGLVI